MVGLGYLPGRRCRLLVHHFTLLVGEQGPDLVLSHNVDLLDARLFLRV